MTAVDVWAGMRGGLLPGDDSAYVPPATRHTFEVTSASAKFLCSIVPGGFEDHFLELGEPTDRIYPREPVEFGTVGIERRAEVAAKHAWTRESDYR